MFPVCSYSVPSSVPSLSALLCYVFPVFLVYMGRAYRVSNLISTHLHAIGFTKTGGNTGNWEQMPTPRRPDTPMGGSDGAATKDGFRFASVSECSARPIPARSARRREMMRTEDY